MSDEPSPAQPEGIKIRRTEEEETYRWRQKIVRVKMRGNTLKMFEEFEIPFWTIL